ncbi:MAG TPA: NADH-quinone oxidoreductase subunit L [Coriobacteriia bacterium]
MNWLIAIPALPALAFVVLVFLPRALRNRTLWLSVGATCISLALAFMAFGRVWPGGNELASVRWDHPWVLGVMGGAPISLSMQMDAITAVMLVVITFVGTAVQIYSLSYMSKDEREGWYFAVLSLFTSSMLMLVLADNLLLVFAMWELMGLCSYLLIGFWYELEAPRKASQKAFLTTRVGDLGFLFSLLVIYRAIGTWDITRVLASVPSWGPGVAVAAACGLLLAAMGKSAQVPLHVWLPDAMAGPTPASALIHAATMVAAGVYLVARTLPIFKAAPGVLMATLIVGAITAVVGGLLACVQHDVKKVLAYSTISQLGIMFMGLGAGSVVAAMYHLATHAFFKSLLFLGAGVIIHAAHTQDMREMGGLRKHMPITWITVLIGSLALAGVVPFSGFFSKDAIIKALLDAHLYWAAGVVFFASGLTAFYLTRLYFRVFEGPEQTEHLHEGSPVMLTPMVALATVTVFLGAGSLAFAKFLGEQGEWPSVPLILASTAVAATGIGVGWWFYGRRSVVVNTQAYKAIMGPFYAALQQKLYFDIAYDSAIVKPYIAVTHLLAVVDRSGIDAAVNGVAAGWVAFAAAAAAFDRVVIDGAVNGLATLSKRAGTALRSLQTGRLQGYQRLVLSAVVLFMLYLVLYVVVKGA